MSSEVGEIKNPDLFTFYTQENLDSDSQERFGKINTEEYQFRIASFKDISPQIILQTSASIQEIDRQGLSNALSARVDRERLRMHEAIGSVENKVFL